MERTMTDQQYIVHIVNCNITTSTWIRQPYRADFTTMHNKISVLADLYRWAVFGWNRSFSTYVIYSMESWEIPASRHSASRCWASDKI